MKTIAEKLNSYKSPDLDKKLYMIDRLDQTTQHLKSRQIISLTLDEMDQLSKDENSWFVKNDIDEYNKLLDADSVYMNDYDFSDITNGYGISEYYGNYERYLPLMYYLSWAKNNNKDILVNVYDADSLFKIDLRNEMLRSKIVGYHQKQDHFLDHTKLKVTPCNFNIALPNILKYTMFNNSNFVYNEYFDSYIDPITILSTNIPYEIYKIQPLPYGIYTQDIDTKEYSFGPYTQEEFEAKIIDIATNGIQNPLFMRLNGGVLSSPEDDTMITILIAKMLKIPYIPVNIYFSNESSLSNKIIDLLGNKQLYQSADILNIILQPEFYAYQTGTTISDLTKSYEEINHDEFVTIAKVGEPYEEDINTSDNSEVK